LTVIICFQLARGRSGVGDELHDFVEPVKQSGGYVTLVL